MGRSFANSSYVSLPYSIIPSGNAPLTLACWFRTAVTASDQVMITVGDTSDQSKHALVTRAAANMGIWSEETSGNSKIATVGPYTANKWHQAIGRMWSTGNRIAILEGIFGAPQTSVRAVTSMDFVCIGGDLTTGPTTHYTGDLAEVGIWEIGLFDEQCVLLSKGYSPLMIMPHKLVLYASLRAGAPMWTRGRGWHQNKAFTSNSGQTTLTDHPQGIIYPWTPQQRFKAPAAAGGGRIMSSLAHRGGLVGAGGIAGAGGGLAS